MIKTFLFLLLGCRLTSGLSAAELTKVGQPAPQFKVTTLAGKTIDLSRLKGKVVLLNFFATWCAPCMEEMPRLEKEIWQTFRTNKNFVVVAIARGQSLADLKQFLKKNNYTFALAPDPKRKIYSKFAAQDIPRNYLIDATGHIVFQSEGYEEKDFNQLAEAVKKELAK